MMKLTLAEPKHLKESVTIISDLVNEAQFKIGKDGLELIAMDPANVAMVIFKLLSSCFTEYLVDKEAQIGINLANFKQILRRIGTNDILTLELDDGKLKITLSGRSKRIFNLPLIDIEEKEKKVPKLEFSASITLPSSVLNEVIEDADIVAESISFMAEPKKLGFNAEGDLNNVNIEMHEDNEIHIKANAKARSKYSIEYLKKMVGGSKLADKVEIDFSNNYPLQLTYKAVDKLMLSFILAPRVEND